jgi:hypothetical protein
MAHALTSGTLPTVVCLSSELLDNRFMTGEPPTEETAEMPVQPPEPKRISLGDGDLDDAGPPVARRPLWPDHGLDWLHPENRRN